MEIFDSIGPHLKKVSDYFDLADPYLGQVSDAVGIPIDQVKIIVVFLAHIVCACVFPLMGGRNRRHLWSFFVGFMSIYFLYRDEVWVLLIFHIITHRLIRILKKHSALISMVAMFTLLSIYHITKMYQAYGKYEQDITLVLMNQTTKVTYLAWAVHDFYKLDEQLPKSIQGRKINKLPGLREYLSYTFGFLGFAGPFVDYKDYIDFIYQESNYRSIKTSAKQCAQNFALLIGCMVLFLVCNPYLKFNVIATDEWGTYNIGEKFLYIVIAGFVLRHRYYIAFTYGQIAVDISGLSWNEQSQSNDLYRNFDWYRLESDMRTRDRFLAWNMSVQRWLQRTCYDRVIDKLGSSKGAVLVYSLSAFWHGFYPCYYVLFLSAFFLNENQRMAFKNRDVLAKLPSIPCKIITQLYYLIIFNFCGMLIQMLPLNETWQAQKATYFMVAYPVVVQFVILPQIIRWARGPRPKREAIPDIKKKE